MSETKAVDIISFNSSSKLLHVSSLYRGKCGKPYWNQRSRSCENVYQKYFSNDGECHYLFDKDAVGCNYTWLIGGKRYKRYMWWD